MRLLGPGAEVAYLLVGLVGFRLSGWLWGHAFNLYDRSQR